jgi:hypothetical protein
MSNERSSTTTDSMPAWPGGRGGDAAGRNWPSRRSSPRSQYVVKGYRERVRLQAAEMLAKDTDARQVARELRVSAKSAYQ